MIKGTVRNESGRAKHKFKKNILPGQEVPLSYLYKLYKNKYCGKFDLEFIDWLKENKVKEGSGFTVIIEKIVEEDTSNEESKPQGELVEVSSVANKIHPLKLTSRQIAELKIKDEPKKIIPQIMSIHKLRRALTMCKDRPGKETLTKLIRERITELN